MATYIPTTAELHEIPRHDQNKPFAELTQFLFNKFDMTPHPTPRDIREWLLEHQQYMREQGRSFGYREA
jgi:hypothetical protein